MGSHFKTQQTSRAPWQVVQDSATAED